jgi:hypothetical protein
MRTEMKVLIALAALALAMATGGDEAAAADASMQTARPSHVRADQRNHVGGRPYSSYYLGRPAYYSPGPFFPWLPFIPDWRDPSGW